jgi:uncharacterized protein YrrD
MSTIRETIGLPVVTTSSADRIGTVGGVVVDDGRVRAIEVDGAIVGWADIHAVGTDAVVVESSEVLRAPEGEVERRVLEDDLAILDKLALDDLGDRIGQVTDLEFDPGDGSVRSVHVLDRRIDGDRLRGIGRYAVVLAAA